jgi:hypothetical protein
MLGSTIIRCMAQRAPLQLPPNNALQPTCENARG